MHIKPLERRFFTWQGFGLGAVFRFSFRFPVFPVSAKLKTETEN
jgi:hypothetical protein